MTATLLLNVDSTRSPDDARHEESEKAADEDVEDAPEPVARATGARRRKERGRGGRAEERPARELAPQSPSHVFFGLTTGASGRVPQVRPT